MLNEELYKKIVEYLQLHGTEHGVGPPDSSYEIIKDINMRGLKRSYFLFIDEQSDPYPIYRLEIHLRSKYKKLVRIITWDRNKKIENLYMFVRYDDAIYFKYYPPKKMRKQLLKHYNLLTHNTYHVKH